MIDKCFFVLVLVALCGCSASNSAIIIDENGQRVGQAAWARAQAAVERRATFELDCSQADLSFKLLRALNANPVEIGVIGCGQRLVYVGSNFSGWLLTSVSTQGVTRPKPIRRR